MEALKALYKDGGRGLGGIRRFYRVKYFDVCVHVHFSTHVLEDLCRVCVSPWWDLSRLTLTHIHPYIRACMYAYIHMHMYEYTNKQGVAPALVEAPMAKFGDVAANVGVLHLMNNHPDLKDLPMRYLKRIHVPRHAFSLYVCVYVFRSVPTKSACVKPLDKSTHIFIMLRACLHFIAWRRRAPRWRLRCGGSISFH